MNNPSNPEEAAKMIAKLIDNVRTLERTLDNKEYWIKEAEKVGFVRTPKSWISVQVETWKIEVSVHNGQDSRQTKVWINGQWFDTYFPKEIPFLSNLVKE